MFRSVLAIGGDGGLYCHREAVTGAGKRCLDGLDGHDSARVLIMVLNGLASNTTGLGEAAIAKCKRPEQLSLVAERAHHRSTLINPDSCGMISSWRR